MEWISVKDRLPDGQDMVLVYTDMNSTTTAYLHGVKSGFITYGEEAYIEFGNITHWKHLQPPKQ